MRLPCSAVVTFPSGVILESVAVVVLFDPAESSRLKGDQVWYQRLPGAAGGSAGSRAVNEAHSARVTPTGYLVDKSMERVFYLRGKLKMRRSPVTR